MPGVSSFQLHFASRDILTPGDHPHVLVAMNPAALRANLADLRRGRRHHPRHPRLHRRNLTKAGYAQSPLDDGSLDGFQLHAFDLTGMTVGAVKEFGLSRKDAARVQEHVRARACCHGCTAARSRGRVEHLTTKFARKPDVRDANLAAFRAGFHFGETTEAFAVRYEVKPARVAPGRYRNITGNVALSLGIVTAGRLSGLPVFLGAYPITPASDILHELSKHKAFGVTTFQAEDEIAGIGATIGAAYAGRLGVTTTSGPGVSLKAEAMGLAVMLELPLVIVDVQRGGPSTGLPTKTEQADLLQAMFGRNGEAPLPVVAAQSPADCFDAAVEAARLAVTFRTPVMLLSDGYLANGSEPWRIPDVAELAPIDPDFATGSNHVVTAEDGTETEEFWPYLRDPETLARPWAPPGTAGLEHRIGGLEKGDGYGNISYDPANHDFMVRTRQAKVDGIARHVPEVVVDDPTGDARMLVIGWGSTYGPIGAGVRRVRERGHQVAQAHLRHLNPFPANLGEVLRRYDKVVVPEMNLGQLSLLLRAKFLVDAESRTNVRGMPFGAEEMEGILLSALAELDPPRAAVPVDRVLQEVPR